MQMERIARPRHATHDRSERVRGRCVKTTRDKKTGKISKFLLTVFTVILHNSSAQRDEVLPCIVSTRCLARFDATRNVDRSLTQSTRGNGRVIVRVLVARSHHNGEEEEEGCQEGRQEEEGPRLNLTLECRPRASLRRGFDAGIPSAGSGRPPRAVCIPSLRLAVDGCDSHPAIADRGVHAQTRKAGPGPWAPGPA